MTSLQQTIIPPTGGQVLNVLGDRLIIKLDGQDTSDQLALMELEVSVGNGVPPHCHEKFAEAYYLLEGELEVTVEDATHIVGPGTLVQIPRGTIHSYRNLVQIPARAIIWAFPSGIEQFFRTLSEAMTADNFSPAQVGAIAAQYDVKLEPSMTGEV